MILNFDHIAILTTDLKTVSSKLPDWLSAFEQETHQSEGTLEQYACPGSASDPCLLLLEAIQDGPYKNAINKRGPGLHHLACATDSLDAAVQHFASHGMLLHPITLKTYKKKIAWMCRPGIPFLLELTVSKKIKQFEQQTTRIQLPAARVGDHEPIQFIPNAIVTSGPGHNIELQIGDNSCSIDLTA